MLSHFKLIQVSILLTSQAWLTPACCFAGLTPDGQNLGLIWGSNDGRNLARVLLPGADSSVCTTNTELNLAATYWPVPELLCVDVHLKNPFNFGLKALVRVYTSRLGHASLCCTGLVRRHLGVVSLPNTQSR